MDQLSEEFQLALFRESKELTSEKLRCRVSEPGPHRHLEVAVIGRSEGRLCLGDSTIEVLYARMRLDDEFGERVGEGICSTDDLKLLLLSHVCVTKMYF